MSVDVESVKAEAEKTLEAAKNTAAEIVSTATEKGFFSKFQEYSLKLLMPWTLITANAAIMDAPDVKSKALAFVDIAKAEIISVFTLTRSVAPAESFTLYNVVGLWIGIAESLIYAIFGGSLLSLIWNGGVAFALAYTLFWTMTISKEKPLMFYSLILMILYVAFNVYMGITKLLYIIPAVLYFVKALCDALMLVNGYWLYKDVIGPNGSLTLW